MANKITNGNGNGMEIQQGHEGQLALVKRKENESKSRPNHVPQ